MEAIREGVTLFGITLVPRCSPHFRLDIMYEHFSQQGLENYSGSQYLSWRFAFLIGNFSHCSIINEISMGINGGLCMTSEARICGAVDSFGSAVFKKFRP